MFGYPNADRHLVLGRGDCLLLYTSRADQTPGVDPDTLMVDLLDDTVEGAVVVVAVVLVQVS